MSMYEFCLSIGSGSRQPTDCDCISCWPILDQLQKSLVRKNRTQLVIDRSILWTRFSSGSNGVSDSESSDAYPMGFASVLSSIDVLEERVCVASCAAFPLALTGIYRGMVLDSVREKGAVCERSIDEEELKRLEVRLLPMRPRGVSMPMTLRKLS